MKRAPALRIGGLLLVLLLGGCAYFNALYNARRLYDDAQAAAARGEAAAAQAAHRESLEKAARSLERDPDGRWSDDALILIGQNQFALGNCPAAAAALRRVLRETRDPDLAARARAHLGAALYCQQDAAEAVSYLDRALERLEPGSPSEAFARLWRARARFELGRTDSAWADLARVAARDDGIGRAASLEQVVRAMDFDRSELAVQGLHRLLGDPAGDLHADSLLRLAAAVAGMWGGGVAREALEPAPRAPWPGDVRDRVIIERARHAAAAGDTALALEELEAAATYAAIGPANAARLAIARLYLAAASDPAELAAVRRVLLPALAEQDARPIIQAIGVIGTLLERASRGQPLAFFAAAEVARDRLGARALARRLFVTYADVVGTTPWSTKALLAAMQLEPSPVEAAGLRERIARANDVYALAARGSQSDGFSDLEQRLGQALSGLVGQAEGEARRRDVAVDHAISQLDSITSEARADSLRLACGTFADSLGLAGIRRDSVGAACLRDDHVLVDSFLAIDTLALRDSTAVAGEGPVREAPDTAVEAIL